MEVLAYSPSIEAYAETKTASGGSVYHDLSRDITSLQVVRQSMGSSNFTMKLQNKNFKYNGLFTPMDRIVLYATKTQRVKLLSGFITDCDVFSLYQGDVTVKGRCTLYRIEQYYWDPGLYESMKLLWETRNTNSTWAGYAQTISDLLTNVASWPQDRIYIGEVPSDAQDFAREMYEAGQESSDVLKSRIDEFYEILRTHGPQLTGGGGNLGSGNGMAVWNLYISWEGKFTYSQGAGRLNLPESGAGDCSSSIYCAYQKAAGVDCGTWMGDMVNKGELVEKGSGKLPVSKMAVADLIIVNHSGYNASYDHVELFGPNNQYAGHGGPGRGPTIKQDAESYGAREHDWQVRRYLFGNEGDGGGTIDFGSSESAFVKKWGQRIDRFAASYTNALMASFRNGALYGHGDTIARESYRNRVDPRIVCAIAGAESGYGAVTTYGGSKGSRNYWSWSAGIWAGTVDGAIAEFCQKFAQRYAGKDMEGCIALGYGGADAENAYIRKHWPPVINGI